MSDLNQNADISALLDMELDDLVDMPEFKPFPAGTHLATISFETKTVSNIPSVELTIKGIETVELADPQDAPIQKGDSTSVLYMLKDKEGNKNQLGEGSLKNVLRILGEHFGLRKVDEIMAAAKDAEVVVTTKLRVNKTDPTKKYAEVVTLAVV